jgi:hypothetical protein
MVQLDPDVEDGHFLKRVRRANVQVCSLFQVFHRLAEKLRATANY